MLTIENERIALGVDEATGQIRRLAVAPEGGDKVELFAQLRGDLADSVGGVTVTDELARRRVSDLQTDGFTMVEAKAEADAITITKRYDGADFDVTTSYRLDGAELAWAVRVTKRAGADRSVAITQFLPQLVGWQFWAPAARTPFGLDGMSSWEYHYVNTCGVGYHEVAVPVVAVYEPSQGVGLAMALPCDARIPAAKFQSVNGDRRFAWGHLHPHVEERPYVEVVQYLLGLRDEPLEVSLVLAVTAGDWRPALGWAVRKWSRYFFPQAETILRRKGIYYCGSAKHADYLDHLQRFNIRFFELHAHFPHYGLYFPEDDRPWRDIGLVEHGEPHVPVELSVDELRQRTDRFAEAGVNSYYYFQLNDGYQPWVEQRFPESICRNEDGSPQPSGWRLCHNMNADLSRPWGQFQLESARKIVAAYPNIAGFFLDCWRHYDLDFAHDDGLTMVNNRPCYSVNFHYDEIAARIAELLHSRGKETFANKPHTIRSCADIDSVLMEGSGESLEWMMFYTALARPYYYLWTESDLPTEEWLKRSLAFGAYPMGPGVEAAGPEVARLYDAYLPLYELLRGRVLCFDPDPVTFPVGMWGQLYTLPGGRYACVVVRDGTSCFDEGQPHLAPEVELRLPSDPSAVHVHYPGPDAAIGSASAVIHRGARMTVPLPRFSSAAVVVCE